MHQRSNNNDIQKVIGVLNTVIVNEGSKLDKAVLEEIYKYLDKAIVVHNEQAKLANDFAKVSTKVTAQIGLGAADQVKEALKITANTISQMVTASNDHNAAVKDVKKEIENAKEQVQSRVMRK